MWRRVPWKAWIGISLIVAGAGLFGAWRWWMVTRTWVPLEVPISLKQGHIRSPEFKINVDGGFWIWVEVETQIDNAAVSCWIGYETDYCQKNGVHEMRANWTLSESGKILAQGDTSRYRGASFAEFYRARGVGSFDGHAGDHYVLDVEIPEDFSRFDAFRPRLAIVSTDYWHFDDEQFWVFEISTLLVAIGVALALYPVAVWIRRKNDYQSISLTVPGPLPNGFVTGTDSPVEESPVSRRRNLSRSAWIGLVLVLGGTVGYYEISLRWIAVLLVGTGASLLILGWTAREVRPSNAPTLGLSPNHSQNIQWAQRLPLRPPISRLPGFGVIGGTVFVFLVILFMILAPVTPKGHWVHLLKPGNTPTKPDAWTDPLIVTVKDDGAGRDPKLFVNSKETAWDDLDRVLKQELAARKDWIVYVGGDNAIPYQSVTNVIDAARGRGAKVVLIAGKK